MTKWSLKDLLSNDRVFTSRYVYKLKRSAITGEVYRFQARLIVRGFQMEKGVDFDDSFSPTGLALGRFMLSLAVANDYERHACDIEQAFLQADKLPEGVNGKTLDAYFISEGFEHVGFEDRVSVGAAKGRKIWRGYLCLYPR